MGLLQKSEMKIQGCFRFREGAGMQSEVLIFEGKITTARYSICCIIKFRTMERFLQMFYERHRFNPCFSLPDLTTPNGNAITAEGIEMFDSRRGDNTTELNFIFMRNTIITGIYPDIVALEQLHNWDFRQFCRNWDSDEFENLQRISAVGSREFSPSKKEILIGMYFGRVWSNLRMEARNPIDWNDTVLPRMITLMRYRPESFVMDLFNLCSTDDVVTYMKTDRNAMTVYDWMETMEDVEKNIGQHAEDHVNDSDENYNYEVDTE